MNIYGPFLVWGVDKTGNEGYYIKIYIVKIFYYWQLSN